MKTKLRCLSVIAALALLCSSVAIVGCGGGGGGGGSSNPVAAGNNGGSGSGGTGSTGSGSGAVQRPANCKTIVVNLPVPAAPAGGTSASVRANPISNHYKDVKLYEVSFVFDRVFNGGDAGNFECWRGFVDITVIKNTPEPQMEYTLKATNRKISGKINKEAVTRIQDMAKKIGDEIYVISVDENPPENQEVKPRLAVLNIEGATDVNFVEVMKRLDALDGGGKDLQKRLDALAEKFEQTTFLVVLDTAGALGVTSAGRFMEGDEVTVADPTRPNDGFNFIGWKLDDKDKDNVENFKRVEKNKTTTFKIKKASVKLTAQWQEVNGLEYKLQDDEKSYHVIANGSNLRKLVIPEKYVDPEDPQKRELPVTAIESGCQNVPNTHDDYFIHGDYDSRPPVCSSVCFPNLEELTIPGSIATIGADIFSNCKNLAKLNILEGVTCIDNHAFANCTGLTEIKVPNSLKVIGHCAFKDCTAVTSISLGSGADIIDGLIMGNNWENLTKIVVDSANPRYSAEGNCLIEDDWLLLGCKTSQIPPKVKSIKVYAFQGNQGVTSLTIPDTVETIDDGAFAHCARLLQIKLGKGIKSIKRHTFEACRCLGEITIPGNVKTIEPNAFFGCEGLAKINIEEGLESIEQCAFYNCVKLEKIKIPDSVKNIDYDAFKECQGLTEATIGANVKSIKSVFGTCPNLEKITLADTVTNIGGYYDERNSGFRGVFSDFANLKEINIPKNVTFIGETAFDGCTGLEKITVANENTKYQADQSCLISLDDKAIIKGCKTSIIPANGELVTTIKSKAFKGCKIPEVTIPANIVKIEKSAFENCTALEKIIIPETVTSLEDHAFAGCRSLTKAVVNGPSVLSDGIFADCVNLKDLELNNGITSLQWGAFEACTSLVEVNLPASIDNFQGAAFKNCSSLKKINIPAVKTIPEDAFCGCASLTAVTLPDFLGEIRHGAFSGCASLKKINIPMGVASIDNGAFSGCSGLEEITVNGANDNSTYYASGSCLLQRHWSENWDYEKQEWVTTLSSIELIAGCKNSKIDSKVKKIAEGAFEGCTDLTEITIPAGVTEIGSNAFKGCTNLAKVNYGGTQKEWKNATGWSASQWWGGACDWSSVLADVVNCKDGVVPLH